jgi:acetyltransferase-like isoleucine patch superfamily enzyme
MTTESAQLNQRYPQTQIEPGAVVPTSCRVGAGCQISGEARLEEIVILEKNVRLVGAVTLRSYTTIRQNNLLVGPLEVMEKAILSMGVKVGLAQAEGDSLVSPTRIGRQVHIGIGAEILGGVVLGDHCRIRAGSRVVGDVPEYGLAGGESAVLENYVCSNCSCFLRSLGRVGLVYDFGCPVCGQTKIRIPANENRPKMSHVLLPGGKSGAFVALDGLDPRWVDDLEMRWRVEEFIRANP